MTVISALVMICICCLPQPLQFPEKLLVRAKVGRGSAAPDQNQSGGSPEAVEADEMLLDPQKEFWINCTFKTRAFVCMETLCGPKVQSRITAALGI